MKKKVNKQDGFWLKSQKAEASNEWRLVKRVKGIKNGFCFLKLSLGQVKEKDAMGTV